MSEDNKNIKSNDDYQKEIEQLKRENAAKDMKLRRSDEDLYSEDYLEFLQKRDKQQPQNNFMSGGKLSDYSEEEMKDLPMSKLVTGIANEVYSQLKSEENKKMTSQQARVRKKKVADTRVEIKKFAKDHPDFWNYVARVDELADENPNLNTEQLYVLAGGKLEEKPSGENKQETKKKEPPPDTRPQNEGGMKQSDKNLSRREIIMQEYQKLK